MKNNFIKAFLVTVLFSSFLFGENAETLECPAEPSSFTLCALDNNYDEAATNDTDKYVQSTDFGSKPFYLNGGVGVVLNPLTVTGGTPELAVDYFFGVSNYHEDGRGFICDDLIDENGERRKNVNVTLSKLNLASGRYQCDYRDAHSSVTIIKCDYQNKACAADLSNVKNGFKAVRTKTHAAEYIFFPDYLPDTAMFTGKYIEGFYQESDPYNGIEPLNYRDLGRVVDQLEDANFLDVYGIAEHYGLNDTTNEVDGGAKYRWNVSGVIAGLITLDKNYFSGVSVDGNILLKKAILSDNPAKDSISDAVNNEKGIYNYLFSESTTVNGSDGVNEVLKDSVFNSSGNEKISSLVSFVSQFDKKLWGFWVTINSNISKGYEKISQFTFFLAAIWMIGVLGIQRGIRAFQKSQQDNSGVGMKIFGAAAGLVFFFVPVSSTTSINLTNTSSVDAGTFERGLPSGRAKFNEDTSFSSSYREHMTIYKFFIQHFAQTANEFATITSNASLVSFADYLTSRQNAFKSRTELGAEIKKSYLHVLQAEKEYNFLVGVCAPMYRNGYEQRKTFLLSDMNLKRYMYNQINKEDDGWEDYSSIADWSSFRTISGIDIVDPTICRSLEKAYKGDVRLALDSFHSIATKATHTDADTAIGTEIVIHNMFIMQSFLGWINSATMPISYFLLKQANMFADGGKDASLSDRVGNAKDMTDGLQTDFSESQLSSSLQSAGDSIGEGAGYVMSYPIAATVYFMAPGFDNLFEYIFKLFKNAFLTEENNQNKNVLEKLIKKIWSKISFTPMDFAGNLLNSKFTLMIVSMVIAVWLYTFMLNVIFMSLIALMILLRIILYFVDLLKYYFVSPFVVIWSVTTTRSYEKVTGFIAQGAVLTLYPTLIVLSSVVFIFAYELMQMLAGMMIGSLVTQLETQYSIINSTSVGGGGAFAFMDYLKIYTLEKSLELTMTLMSLFIAYKIIYDGPSWFLSMFGYKEGDTYGGQMMREVSDRVNKTSNPVI